MTRRRTAFAIASIVFVIAATVVVVLSGREDGRDDPPVSSEKSIVSFVERDGSGGEVVVPDGRYEGGTIDVPHESTLVLRAETQGGVTVDLALTGLWLEDPVTNVVFVGFRFVNGTVRLAGAQDVTFWYCDFTFPPEKWSEQYEAAGGTVPATAEVRKEFGSKMENPLPSAIRMRTPSGDPSRHNQGIAILGSDFHDIGDDAIFFSNASDVRVEGVRIWNIDEKGDDPEDWFHNDGIQTTGAVADVVVADSWIGQKIQWGAEGGEVEDVRFQRLWVAGSRTFGQIVATKDGGRILRNSQQDIRAFGNGQGSGGYAPANDKFRIDIVDGEQQAIWPNHHDAPGGFEIETTDVTTTAPEGVTMRDGLIVDLTEVLQHPHNPANLWRVLNPYEEYRTLFGLD